MASYVAFLRAINVGGRVVKMEALKKSFVRLGFSDVDTFIASGNVLFSSRAKDTAKLERQIEKQLEKDLGYEVSTFVRTVEEVIEVSGYVAFSGSDVESARVLYVGFLAAPLSREAQTALGRMASDLDRFHANGREWYWLTWAKQGESKISNGAIEKALKVRSTLRGMNTIVRLAGRLSLQTQASRNR
ncbi:MAG TPA: DUF1697 domain-containing protein [Vicinamibacterales bacterium]|nr:DUF1697 domain-containing protein [Vicinamibacterales bacterium]